MADWSLFLVCRCNVGENCRTGTTTKPLQNHYNACHACDGHSGRTPGSTKGIEEGHQVGAVINQQFGT